MRNAPAATVFTMKLSAEDRARLERLAADAGAAVGKPVGLADVIRQLVRDATAKKVPVRIRLPHGLT